MPHAKTKGARLEEGASPKGIQGATSAPHAKRVAFNNTRFPEIIQCRPMTTAGVSLFGFGEKNVETSESIAFMATIFMCLFILKVLSITKHMPSLVKSVISPPLAIGDYYG